MKITLWANKILNLALLPWISSSLLIHGDRHFIDMSSTPLKCRALYCDKQLFSCTINLYYIHFKWIYTNISIYVEMMNNCVHALHPYAITPFLQHPQAQEVASPHCS